tara:strand:+ start:1427 stop:1594 length:168 start_codon:yes stop_codon:yes gene_type:complete
MDKYKDIYDLAKDINMKHIVDEENNRECWVTSDGQAHYDIKVATLRQLELLNDAL